MLLIAQSDAAISQRLNADLADVESRFASELISDLPCVNRLVTHIERYRGKMLRPTLVLVSAMASEVDAPTREDQRVVATVVEMVHMATLVHDDILDEAAMRRRGETINELSGNETAVMLGDYLISHAYHLCTSIGRAEISRTIAEATNVVCEGELLQLANRNNLDLDEQTYFEIIRRKTASLCGVCCRVAAVLNDSPAHVGEALYGFGEKLGVAFQIVDDVLDLTGDEATVGKTLGRDLEKGKLTLPMIRYLAQADPADREAVSSMLSALSDTGEADPEHFKALDRVRCRLRDSDALAYSRQRASSLVADAKASVTEHLPSSSARELLLGMADAVLTREF